MADQRVLEGVKIVDAATPANSATVDAGGNLQVILASNDGVDVGDVDVATLPAVDHEAEDDSIAFAISSLRTIGLMYGSNGATWERIATDGLGSMDVNVTLALPTGANVIGEVTIGAASVAAGDLAKAESATHVTADVGVAVWGVRNDAETLLAADGEYIPFMMSSAGRVLVETQGGAGGGTFETDSDPFAPASDSYTPVGGIFDDVAPADLSEGDGGAVRMSAVREMYTNIRDGAGGERSANVTAAFELNVIASAQAGVDIGDVTVNGFAAAETDTDDDIVADSQVSLRTINLMYGYDGTQWERIQTDAGGAMDVNIVAGGGESLPTSPVRTTGSSTDTAAAATFSQDGPSADGTTTKVRGFDCCASVPIKAELQSVIDDAGTTLLVMFAQAGERLEWRAPHRNFFSVAHGSNGGFDGFRIVLTNLDNENAADLYTTLYTED